MMHKVFHSRDDIERLYVVRKKGGGGLVCIEDSMDASSGRLEDYIRKSKERLIIETRNNTNNIKIIRKTSRKQIWVDKLLYEYFKQQTGEISHLKT